MDGYIDFSSKKIKVCKTLLKKSRGFPEIENRKLYFCKVLRHEIIHAFHMESGFDNLDVLNNEQIVDWFAHMLPKIDRVFNSVVIPNEID
jgi:hypothetical protein